MHQDVQDLRNFYYRSPLGRAVQKVFRDQVTALWPEAKAQTVLGYGFAVPLLRPYLAEARRVIALMPAPQGVMAWPAGQPNVAVLAEETQWPVPTGLVDKLVVMHGLETSERPGELLEECWRVLGPGGRAIFIVPNRMGLWSRSEATPFGHGHPYSPSQLEGLLRNANFVTERSLSALYQPPSPARIWRKWADFLEGTGRHLPVFKAGGALIVEVSKQIAAPTKGGHGARVRRQVKVPLSLPAPAGRVAGGTAG